MLNELKKHPSIIAKSAIEYLSQLKGSKEIKKRQENILCFYVEFLCNEISEEDVLNSPEIWPNVMTKLMACPPTCGAAAAILVSPEFATALNINSSVRIIGQAMTTDDSGTFESDDMIQLVGYDMSKAAAQQVYEQTSIGPEDVSVVELHDCFAHFSDLFPCCNDGDAVGEQIRFDNRLIIFIFIDEQCLNL